MIKLVAYFIGLTFAVSLLLSPILSHGQVVEQVIHSFGIANQSGANPGAPVIVGVDGSLYGTTVGGGSNGVGTVFKVNTNGTGYTILHSFSTAGNDGQQPSAGLIQGRDGALYGTTPSGGSNSVGTVFKINTNGTGYALLHNFSTAGNDGKYPYSALIQGKDGALYGTANGGGTNGSGAVFRINTNSAGYSVLHSFSGFAGGDGDQPRASLVQGADGALYGATYYGGAEDVGTVFRINTNGTSYALLYSFSASGGDGQSPAASVIQASDGLLYGTTESGGTDGVGTVFKLDTNGMSYSALRSFTIAGNDGQSPIASLMQGSDGALYGTTPSGGTNGLGTVFKLSTNGTAYTRLRSFKNTGNDAALPQASLMQTGDGTLFGTTASGGMAGVGAVYRISTNGASYSVIYSFSQSGFDGTNPRSTLIQGFDSALYGTTQQGGTNANFGTVFKLNKDGTGYSILHSFTNTPDGAYPVAGLLQGRDGALYGTTTAGGIYSVGVVFKINTNGTGYTNLHDFVSLGDGARPAAPLIQVQDGRLYGTTPAGNGNEGTIFWVTTNGNYGQIFLFQSVNLLGYRPLAAVLQGSDNMLYGTTSLGGNSGGFGKGVIFKVSTNGQGYTVLHNFGSTSGDGIEPHSALVQTSDGALYGMSTGAAFKIQTNGTSFTVLHALTLEPAVGLTVGGDGRLYGLHTSAGGGVVDGLFRMDTTGSNYTVFQNPNPASDAPRIPYAPLLQANDGAFYGTTDSGGAMDLGTVFRLSLAIAPQILSQQLSGTNFTFSLQTTSGQSYTVQTSTNLAISNWVFYTNVTGTGSLVQFVVPAAAPPQRFFRISAP